MNLTLLLYILIGVYLLAINFYGILILVFQKKSKNYDQSSNGGISDAKIILTGLLGGAVGIYTTMFITKYKLKSIFIMILMPLFIAVDVFLAITFLTGGFGQF